jgi:hypothetical protein
LNTKSDYSSGIKVDLAEQVIPKLLYFDPSDDQKTSVISFLAGALAATIVQYLIREKKKQNNDKQHGMIILRKMIDQKD